MIRAMHALIFTTALITTSMTAQAEALKYDRSKPIDPAATETYAEAAECLSMIGTLGNFNEGKYNMALAMLGRLPACEVARIVEAMDIKRVNMLNQQ